MLDFRPYLAPHTARRFTADCSVAEANSRLNAAFTSDSFAARMERVKHDRVFARWQGDTIHLWRKKPMPMNQMKPIFDGTLRTSGEGVILDGRFRLHAFAKWLTWLLIFGALFFLGGVVYEHVTGVSVLADGQEVFDLNVLWQLILFGIVLPALGWWWGWSDIPFLEERIAEALRGEARS